MQEERAAREAAEARADAAHAEAGQEIAALRDSLGAESAQQAAARESVEKELEELKVALAQARTATDAVRAQLTAEKIQAQQRTAGFEKTKQEIEVPHCVCGSAFCYLHVYAVPHSYNVVC